MNNRKGFTLIEILAVIVIIGLLSGIAVGGSTIYIEKTRQKAYDAMEHTLYDSAQNYIIEKGVLVPESTGLTIDSSRLIEYGYIKELQDPASKDDNRQCTGSVNVQRRKNTGSKLDEYTYTVNLRCIDYNNTRTFNS